MTEKPPRFLTVLNLLLKWLLFIRLPSAPQAGKGGQNNTVRQTLLLLTSRIQGKVSYSNHQMHVRCCLKCHYTNYNKTLWIQDRSLSNLFGTLLKIKVKKRLVNNKNRCVQACVQQSKPSTIPVSLSFHFNCMLLTIMITAKIY